MCLFFPLSLRSAVLTVWFRQRCTAPAVCEGAQSTSREVLSQTSGPNFICAQHPSILPRGTVYVARITQRIANCVV